MIFDDQFSGTSLDTTKWNTYLGAQGIAWNNYARIAMPYSGPNTPSNNEQAMYGPSQVSVNDGLTLTAQRNTNAYAGTYPWIERCDHHRGQVQPAHDRPGTCRPRWTKVPDMTQGLSLVSGSCLLSPAPSTRSTSSRAASPRGAAR